jgi:hypothetical protein
MRAGYQRRTSALPHSGNVDFFGGVENVWIYIVGYRLRYRSSLEVVRVCVCVGAVGGGVGCAVRHVYLGKQLCSE